MARNILRQQGPHKPRKNFSHGNKSWFTVHALIYSFKQNTIQSWNAPLPQIENLVLNGTFTSWQDVIDLTKKIPSLTELHACENGNYVYSYSVSDHLPTSS